MTFLRTLRGKLFLCLLVLSGGPAIETQATEETGPEIQPAERAAVARAMAEYENRLQAIADGYSGISLWMTQQTGNEHEIMARYVEAMKQVDLRGCPEDFVETYRVHVAATEALRDSQAKLNKFSLLNNAVAQFFIGKKTHERRKLEREHKAIEEAHQRSYNQLQRVVLRYTQEL